MSYAQSTAKGHIRAKENVFLPQVQIRIHYLKHIPPLKIWRNLQNTKLNEPGRPKLGIGIEALYVSRHSNKSYILTCFRFRKREPLIALSSHEGGLLFLHPRYPTVGWGQM